MQDAAYNRRFAELYEQQLPSPPVKYAKKLLITFCGVPGSGKTTLAKRLAKDLSAHRVNNDEIRKLLEENGQSLEEVIVGPISSRVIEDILEKSENKVVIADSSIDRKWPKFFATAERADVPTYIMRMNCSKQEIKKRLKKRGCTDTYVDRHEVFFDQFESCREYVEANLELWPDYDYEQVLAAIRARL